MVWYRLSAADLVRCWCLVSGSHRHLVTITSVDHHQTTCLSQVLSQHSTGLGLTSAIEVAGHVVRHRAVLAAVTLEAGLGTLQ